uniref:LysR family transcriptional regulator substrate-binding protein n=1 Tax=Salmonella sp. SAL4436 TaxID=3159891 RepID=UPI00397DF35D
AQGTIDLAVLVDPPPGIGGVTLAEDTFFALLNDDHPLAKEKSMAVTDLEDDPFLLSTGGCERHIRELFRRAKMRYAPAHRIREMATLFA